ncbi:MAG: Lipolytic protein G-D-S-L family [Candidatus Uhrbacteria bacterium GW2011_GWF2_39_13]|uniref:Lipolytic protein G-D-S-L family n=1 Tax=Candidatus Uhrbacteria bacterium GW2011_GWF2_39_13 TaxID=1618995 RepID=A0A0G0MGP8_9BACT|nr:MAG: Lipolytic protein G-D-S-L family [Candidatus Uhrbacteria bacterium GW2011_GWF2_39_13]
MKEKLYSGITTALLVFSASLFSEDANLLKNGSFEKGVQNIGLASTTIEDWEIIGDKAGFVCQDAAACTDGDISLKIHFQKKQKEDWKIFQSISATEFKKNTDYYFSGWMQTYKGSSIISIQLKKDGRTIKEIILSPRSDDKEWDGYLDIDKSGWKRYTADLNTMDSDNITVMCTLKNKEMFIGDTCWFDGLSLIEKIKVDRATKEVFPHKIFVSKNGNDVWDGSEKKPFATIQKAVSLAGYGTHIKITKGIYNEKISFTRGGTPEKPLILEGQDGVIIENAKETELKWEAVPEWGEGVYRAKSAFSMGLFADGKNIIAIRYERTHPDFMKNEIWQYRNLFKNGVIAQGKTAGHGFDFLKALWMYNPEDKCIYIKFANLANPKKIKFRLADASSCIDIQNAPNIIINNLELRYSVKGCVIKHSENITVKNCKMTSVEYSAMLLNAKSCKIINNEMTITAYNSMDPTTMYFIDSMGNMHYQHDVWNAHKWAGYYDRVGVAISSDRGDTEIANNYIHDNWDGISNYGTGNKGLKVHHNTILRCMDDGLVFNAQCENQEWYNNTVISAFCSFRMLSTKGPVYIYGNRFTRPAQDQLRIWCDSLADVYIYHNTVIDKDGMAYFGQKKTGTPNYKVYNNRFLGNYMVIRKLRKGGTEIMPDFKADYNCYLSDRNDIIRKYGFEKNGYCGMDYKEKGADLSKFFGKPLPGCPPGYFKGNAPDCGAEQLK